jgi:hypothetical protein
MSVERKIFGIDVLESLRKGLLVDQDGAENRTLNIVFAIAHSAYVLSGAEKRNPTGVGFWEVSACGFLSAEKFWHNR